MIVAVPSRKSGFVLKATMKPMPSTVPGTM